MQELRTKDVLLTSRCIRRGNTKDVPCPLFRRNGLLHSAISIKACKKRKKRNENKEVEADKMLRLSVDGVINTMPLDFCNKMRKLS